MKKCRWEGVNTTGILELARICATMIEDQVYSYLGKKAVLQEMMLKEFGWERFYKGSNPRGNLTLSDYRREKALDEWSSTYARVSLGTRRLPGNSYKTLYVWWQDRSGWETLQRENKE